MSTRSGLIRADSQTPHSRQQTRRNVRQVGYTLQTFDPQLCYLTPPARSALCVCLHAVKPARYPEAKHTTIPNSYTLEGGLFLKSMKPIIVYLCVAPQKEIKKNKSAFLYTACQLPRHTSDRVCFLGLNAGNEMKIKGGWIMTEALQNPDMNLNKKVQNHWVKRDRRDLWRSDEDEAIRSDIV